MADLAELNLRINSTDVRGATRDLDKLSQTTRRLTPEVDKTEKSFDRTSKTAKRMSASLRQAQSAVIALAGGFTALSLVRSTVTAIADFGDTMATVRAIAVPTNITLEEQDKLFLRLRNSAAEAGARTRFTATQAAEAQLFLARAGFEAEQVISALPGTLNLASAGNLDLATAADIASNAMSQFGIAASEMNRVADILTNTANRSNTSVQQLGEALKYAGPFAAALGKTMEETAAALGVLGDSGIQASLAGTNLRGVLAGLLAPATDEAALALKNIAERAGEAEDAFKATDRTLLEMFNTFKKGSTTPEEFELIFGRRNVSAAISLTNAIEKFGVLTERNFKNVGEAARVAEIRNNTLRGSLLALKSAFEGVQINQTAFGDSLKRNIDTLTSAIRIIGGFATEQEKSDAAAQRLVAVLETLHEILRIVVAVRVGRFFFDLTQQIANTITQVKAFNTASLVNPLIALTGVVLTAAQAYKSFTEAADRAREASRRAAVEAERSGGAAPDSFAGIRAAQARADEAGDLLKKTQELSKQVNAVEGEIQRAIADAAERGKGTLTTDALRQILGADRFDQTTAPLARSLVEAFGKNLREQFGTGTQGLGIGGVGRTGHPVLDALDPSKNAEAARAAKEAGQNLSDAVFGPLFAQGFSQKGAGELAKQLAERTGPLFDTLEKNFNIPQEFSDRLRVAIGRRDPQGTNALGGNVREFEGAILSTGSEAAAAEALRATLEKSVGTQDIVEGLVRLLQFEAVNIDRATEILKNEQARIQGLLGESQKLLAEQEKAARVTADAAEGKKRSEEDIQEQRTKIAQFKEEVATQRLLAEASDAKTIAVIRAGKAAEELATKLALEGKEREDLIKFAKDEAAAIEDLKKARDDERKAQETTEQIKARTQAIADRNEVERSLLEGGKKAADAKRDELDLRRFEEQLIKDGVENAAELVEARRQELIASRDLAEAIEEQTKARLADERAAAEARRNAERDAAKKKRDAERAIADQKREREQAANNLDRFVESLVKDINTFGRTKDAVDAYNVSQAAFNALTAVGVKNAAGLADQAGDLAAAMTRVEEAAGRRDSEGVAAGLEEVLGLLKNLSDAAMSEGVAGAESLAAAYQELAAALDKVRGNFDNLDAAGKKTAPTLANLEKNLESLVSDENLDRIATRLGDAVGTFFEDVILGAKSVTDALKDLVQDVIRTTVEEFVGNPIRLLARSLFNSLFSSLGIGGGGAAANGRVIEHGKFTAFASGGIINTPTAFPLRDGIGLAGEAGPEAIVPLHRGPDGKLGIRQAGGGQQGSVDNRTVNVNLTVNGAKDADSFRKSRRQVAQDLNRLGRSI